MSWVLNPCDVNGVVCENISQDERLALEILKELLAGGRASPLTKALVDSGLGSAPVDAELDFDLKHAVFSVGLKGRPFFANSIKSSWCNLFRACRCPSIVTWLLTREILDSNNLAL